MSNQGPIVQIKQSNSQRSLYSDNDVDSPIQLKSKIIGIKQLNNQNDSQTNKLHKTQAPVFQTKKQTNNNRNTSQRYKVNTILNEQNIEKANNQNIKQQKNINIRQINKSSQKQVQFKHEYKNYKSSHNNKQVGIQSMNQSSPLELLKFNEKIKRSQANEQLENQKKSFNFQSPNSIHHTNEDLRNKSLRSSQGERWLRSQSLMQPNQKHQKDTFKAWIKNYHKHESKMFDSVQKYMKILIQFQQKLAKTSFSISLSQPLQQIKSKIQCYMQKLVHLQHMPIDKPTSEWSQAQLTKFFTNYQPIYLNADSVDSTKQSLTLKKYKNCVYFGQMFQAKKDGNGIIYYFSGKIFQGTFKSDQKIQGFEIDQSSDQIYVGSFYKGLKHGYGILKNNQYLIWGKFTQNIFEIQVQQTENKKQQQTKKQAYKLKQKSKFELTSETFTNTKVKMIKQQTLRNKQGFRLNYESLLIYSNNIEIYKNSSNDIFIGNMTVQQAKQQKNGQGLQIFTNTDIYVGNYQNNVPQGYGQYYWGSGAYYRGQFMSGMRHGNGKWHMLHGDMYQGQYMNDKKNGQGTYLWKNGSKYSGAFENDYRHGYGEMHWNDGRTYKGQWLNGIEKNVKIKLDNGIRTMATIPYEPAKKPVDNKKHFLPAPTRRTLKSTYNPSPQSKNSFHSIDSSHIVKKKIALENIKSLYNPSNE